MNKIINIKSKKTLKTLEHLRDKLVSNTDIKFENVHIKKINDCMRKNIFSKNDVYISSVTLWEIMQPEGSSGSHNYHGLKPEDILGALNELTNPLCVLKAKNERFLIVPIYISSFDKPLIVVLEKGAGLITNKNANINKIVTIYPKSDLDKMIEKAEENNVLYKKMSTNTGLQLP